MPISHVLLDADGVLQRVEPSWEERTRPLLGDLARPLLERFWADEQAALVGEADVVEVLQGSLRATGLDVDATELYPRIWLTIEVLDTTAPLVRALRQTGVGVHLGTNQTRHRALHMRRVLGFDELFDVSVYSCDVGVAKPDPRFFECAVGLIGAAPAEVLFVDDHERNVEGARAAGLAAEHWHHTHGIERLHRLLARHGLAVGTGSA